VPLFLGFYEYILELFWQSGIFRFLFVFFSILFPRFFFLAYLGALEFTSRFQWVRAGNFLKFFVLSYFVFFRFEFCVVMSVTIKTMFGSSLPPVVCRWLLSYLRYLFFLACSGVQNIVLCFCFVCLRLVYPMLPVSLDCLLLVTPSVFSITFIYKIRCVRF